MKNIEIGQKVQGYRSWKNIIIVESNKYNGVITKVNKKSFWVNFTEVIGYRQWKETSRRACDEDVKYTFWKEVNGKSIYRSDFRLYGIIEL